MTRLPAGKNALTPNLVVSDGRAALAFYVDVLGAELLESFEHDGLVLHAELTIGGSGFLVCDAMPDLGLVAADPDRPVHASFQLYVDDVDAVFARAADQGATVLEEPTPQFHGAKTGSLRDPFGHRWSISTHLEDVSPEEMRRRVEAYLAENA